MSEVDSTVQYSDIKGFPGYRVGSDGSVWSCRTRRWMGYGNGSIPAIGQHWRRLKVSPHKHDGHERVTLMPDRQRRFVHRLVLESFVGPCPEGMEACHNDGDPSNNSLYNLRWGTRQENYDDSIRHGRRRPRRQRPGKPKGERHGNARFTEAMVSEIRQRHSNGEHIPKLADEFKTSRQTIWRFVTGKAWTHI